jgi:hypothetical protein
LDPDTTMGGPHGHIPSTQLSLLEAATAGGALPNEALERQHEHYLAIMMPGFRYACAGDAFCFLAAFHASVRARM